MQTSAIIPVSPVRGDGRAGVPVGGCEVFSGDTDSDGVVVVCPAAVSYTHLTLPTNREV